MSYYFKIGNQQVSLIDMVTDYVIYSCIYLMGKNFDLVLYPHGKFSPVSLVKGKLRPSEVPTHAYFKM